MGKQKKLFILPHDGTLNGDNVFYAGSLVVPYTEGMTINMLKVGLTVVLKKEKWDDESIQDMLSQVQGGWIVEPKILDVIADIWDATDPGGDSSTYSCNRACKAALNGLAIKFLGAKPQ